MGNCECLRAPDQQHEITLNMKDKNYDNDYSMTMKNQKAKAFNDKFAIVEHEDDDAKNRSHEDIVIRESAIIMEEKVEEVHNNEPEDEFGVTFKQNNEVSIQNQAKPEEKTNVNANNAVIPPPTHNRTVSTLDKSAYESDIDEINFNSSEFSKNVFNFINELRLNPASLISKIQNFQIPKASSANQNDKDQVINFIQKANTKKGKTFLWNEKAYVVMRPILQRKANGESIKEDMTEVLAGPSVKANLDSYFSISGKYSENDTALLLLLEHSKNIQKLLFEPIHIAAVCAVQSKNKMKNEVSLALIKKK